jgi:hypothetical protein
VAELLQTFEVHVNREHSGADSGSTIPSESNRQPDSG